MEIELVLDKGFKHIVIRVGQYPVAVFSEAIQSQQGGRVDRLINDTQDKRVSDVLACMH